MSTKNPFHFNHFLQSHGSSDSPLTYSMLANSGYSHGDRPEEVDIEPLLESAERYFGKDKLYRRQLFSYDCIKTEFASDDEQKRRYSYWIESDPTSNYLCVLPGKFSFFPTVALQAFQHLKTLIPVTEISAPATFAYDRQSLAKAEELVAIPYPQRILNAQGLPQAIA